LTVKTVTVTKSVLLNILFIKESSKHISWFPQKCEAAPLF